MHMPNAKWFHWYGLIIIAASAIETAVVVHGSFIEKGTYLTLSCITALLGFLASCFVLGSHLALNKVFGIIAGPKYLENINSIAVIIFWFGVVASFAAVITYPIFASAEIPFSIAPVGIGFSTGAKWIFNKYPLSESGTPTSALSRRRENRA